MIAKKTLLTALMLAATTTVAVGQVHAEVDVNKRYETVVPDNVKVYPSKRPPVEERLFTSEKIEKVISDVQKKLRKNPRLAWMFANCFPNTLETTVHYRKTADGDDDTFVYTGDIPAMWLRDSGAQVWPYVQFANDDEPLRHMLRGVILRQFHCINIDPYANAFNDGPT
ncbi:MAG: glycoside hydrolase family 125 protein, partial [Prevotella sp.]|nr:glycoside hydrolase family 125 protein [Prevotella sp.]